MKMFLILNSVSIGFLLLFIFVHSNFESLGGVLAISFLRLFHTLWTHFAFRAHRNEVKLQRV
jgi:hypothetical protein